MLHGYKKGENAKTKLSATLVLPMLHSDFAALYHFNNSTSKLDNERGKITSKNTIPKDKTQGGKMKIQN